MLRPWVEAAPLGSPWDSAITLFQLLWLDPDSSPQRCASLSWRWLDMMQWIVYGDDAVEMIRWQLQKKNLAPCNLHSSIYFVCLTAATTRAPSCLLHFQGLDCSGIRLRTRDIHHGMVPSTNDENRFWQATISPKKIPNSTWYFIARQCLPSNHTNLLSSQSMFSLYMLGNLGSWLVDRFSRYLTLEPRNLKN